MQCPNARLHLGGYRAQELSTGSLSVSPRSTLNPDNSGQEANASHPLSVSDIHELIRHKSGTQNPALSYASVHFRPLGIYGSSAALFRLQVAPFGYTLVCKAVEPADVHLLKREARIYRDRLVDLGGRYVPVCLGFAKLADPLTWSKISWSFVLLQSFAGTSLLRMQEMLTYPDEQHRDAGSKQAMELVASSSHLRRIIRDAERALRAVHTCGVLHGDVEMRNIMVTQQGGCMLLDFGLAKSRPAALDRAARSARSDPNKKESETHTPSEDQRTKCTREKSARDEQAGARSGLEDATKRHQTESSVSTIGPSESKNTSDGPISRRAPSTSSQIQYSVEDRWKIRCSWELGKLRDALRDYKTSLP